MSSAVAVITGIWRYPVKSMAGEELDEVDLSWNGVAGDRRWGLVRGDVPKSGFPYLTIRERSDMGRFEPRLVDRVNPDTSPVEVRTPGGVVYGITDPALQAELGEGLRPLKLDRGLFDVAPLSLICEQSIASLRRLVQPELDVRRFRPNIVVRSLHAGSWPEDEWVGHTLHLGKAKIRVDSRDDRCVIVNVDPETSQRDPGILRAIAKHRDSCIGVYGSAVRPGSIAIGDHVYLHAT